MGNAYERFDRPMIIARTDSIIKSIDYAAYSKINIDYSQNRDYDLDLKKKEFLNSNYICVDKFSNFVVDSNIRLTVNKIFINKFFIYNDIFLYCILLY